MLASGNPYSNGFILLLHVPVRIKKVVGNEIPTTFELYFNVTMLLPAKLVGFNCFSGGGNPANVNSLFQRFSVNAEFLAIRNIGPAFS